MRAITVKQPWASAIIYGGKDVENRAFNFPVAVAGERVWIHAAGTRAQHCNTLQSPVTRRRLATLPQADALGVVIGSVIIDRVVDSETCDLPWCHQVSGGRALILRDPVAFAQPFAATGQLGLWRVPRHLTLRRSRKRDPRVVLTEHDAAGQKQQAADYFARYGTANE